MHWNSIIFFFIVSWLKMTSPTHAECKPSSNYLKLICSLPLLTAEKDRYLIFITIKYIYLSCEQEQKMRNEELLQVKSASWMHALTYTKKKTFWQHGLFLTRRNVEVNLDFKIMHSEQILRHPMLRSIHLVRGLLSINGTFFSIILRQLFQFLRLDSEVQPVQQG